MLLLKNQVRFIRNPTKTSSELRLLLKGLVQIHPTLGPWSYLHSLYCLKRS